MISTRYLQDAGPYRGVDCVSDHNLVIAKTLLKLNRTGRRALQVKTYQTSKLNINEIMK